MYAKMICRYSIDGHNFVYLVPKKIIIRPPVIQCIYWQYIYAFVVYTFPALTIQSGVWTGTKHVLERFMTHKACFTPNRTILQFMDKDYLYKYHRQTRFVTIKYNRKSSDILWQSGVYHRAIKVTPINQDLKLN